MIAVSWPELKLQCSMKAYPPNQELFNWFMSGLPYESIQGHAVISGDLIYTKNIPVPKMTYDYHKLDTQLLTTAIVGTVFINVSRGYVGTIMIKYSTNMTEDMPYPVIGHIIEKDLPTIEKVGNKVWDGYYKTKQFYSCQFTLGV